MTFILNGVIFNCYVTNFVYDVEKSRDCLVIVILYIVDVFELVCVLRKE